MASPTPAERAKPKPKPNYYFAFGSNMHLVQMASRCPGSRIIAKGILPGYRWQINERGVANIVRSAVTIANTETKEQHRASVEGILFTVSVKDIQALDRNEGVSKKLYDKIWLPIRVEPLAIGALEGVKTGAAAKELEMELVRPESQSQSQSKLKEVQALVYLSSQYKKDGAIRSEYIKRMELAMADAAKLGVNESYLRESLYPRVFVVEQPGGTITRVVDLSTQTAPGPKIIEREPAWATAISTMNHGERDHGTSSLREPEPQITHAEPRTRRKPQQGKHHANGRRRRAPRQRQRQGPKSLTEMVGSAIRGWLDGLSGNGGGGRRART